MADTGSSGKAAYTAIPFYFFKLANSFFQVQITVENGGNAS
jgi:hypothetical protein